MRDRRGGRTEPVAELAPAKINLCLHVTGRRPDGYHELDSVVAFAEFGDSVRLEASPDRVSLQVIDGFQRDSDGSDAAVEPSGTGNLAWHALALGARSAGGLPGGLSLSLTKRLPAGAGLGGGSSDAAAVLRWAGFGTTPAALADASRIGAELQAVV